MSKLGGFFKGLFGKGEGFSYYKPPVQVKDGNLGIVIKDAQKGKHDGLDLSGADLTERGLAKLQEMAGTLRALNLKGSTVTDACLAALKGLKALEKLDISETHVFGTCFVKIGNLPKLTELDASNTKLVDKAVIAIRNFPALVRLDISGCTDLTDEAVSHIAGHRSLREVHLRGLKFDQSVLTVLLDRPELKLEGLDL